MCGYVKGREGGGWKGLVMRLYAIGGMKKTKTMNIRVGRYAGLSLCGGWRGSGLCGMRVIGRE